MPFYYVPSNDDRILSVTQLTRHQRIVCFIDNQVMVLPIEHIKNNKLKVILHQLANSSNTNEGVVTRDTRQLYYLDVADDFSDAVIHQVLSVKPKQSPDIEFQTQHGTFQVTKVDAKALHLTMVQAPTDKILKIHCALGHMHWKNMQKIGFYLSKAMIQTLKNCLTCKALKAKRKPTTGHKEIQAKNIFNILHLDTAGPFETNNGKFYVVLIIDEYSRYLTTIVTKSKNSISPLVSEYLQQQYAIFGHMPEKIIDKGTEFNNLHVYSPDIQDPTKSKLVPIVKDVAPTDNKEYNGMSERCVQTIKEIQ